MAASSITATGASCPVHISKEAAPWYTNMSIPPRQVAPACAAAFNSGVSKGLYTRSFTKTVEVMLAAGRGEPASSGPWDMPIVVQFTIKSTVPAAPVALTPGQLGRDVRLVDGQSRRDTLNDYDQSLTVGLTCSKKPDHLRPSLSNSYRTAPKIHLGNPLFAKRLPRPLACI